MNEQQQVIARQLKEQQQAEQPPTQPQTLQQSVQAGAEEEVKGLGTENQSPASPSLGSSLDQPEGDVDLAVPGSTPDVLEQSVSELSAAQPAEPEIQTQEPVPAVETDTSPQLAHASDLPVDERIDVFLKAIRDRSWEQTSRQAVKRAEGEEDSLKLPPSGYSELGSVSQGRFQGQMLNPGRSFFPGQSYDPEVQLLPHSIASNLIKHEHTLAYGVLSILQLASKHCTVVQCMQTTQPQVSNAGQCSGCCLHARDDMSSYCITSRQSYVIVLQMICCCCCRKGEILHLSGEKGLLFLSSERGDLYQCCLGNLFSADCCKSQA